ncbi:MAG: hypothetical protein GXP49_03475 [Deltaproteobacteria bacterium]|nr:hypothetical protein [Deltaproteobacteria bacterium]
MNSIHGDLVQEAHELGQVVGPILKALKEQDRAVQDIQSYLSSENLAGLDKAVNRLSPSFLDRFGLKERALTLQEQLLKRLHELKAEHRRRLGKELKESFESGGFNARLVSDNPPSFKVGRFEIELNLDKMEAGISFCREPLRKVQAKPEKIMDALTREKRLIETSAVEQGRFFDAILNAYKASLALYSGRMGDRVDLVDLLPQVAFMLQPDKFKEHPTKERFISYSRVQFIFDLNRLRESGLLTKSGFRLDLGTATGDSTRKKGRVFFLEDANGEGQYYLSARFVPTQPNQ